MIVRFMMMKRSVTHILNPDMWMGFSWSQRNIGFVDLSIIRHIYLFVDETNGNFTKRHWEGLPFRSKADGSITNGKCDKWKELISLVFMPFCIFPHGQIKAHYRPFMSACPCACSFSSNSQST